MKYVIIFNGQPAYDDLNHEYMAYDIESDIKGTIEDMRELFPDDLWDYQPMTEEEIANLPVPGKGLR